MVNATITQGAAFYRQGKLKEAAALWEKTLALDSNNAEAKTYLHRAKMRIGIRENKVEDKR